MSYNDEYRAFVKSEIPESLFGFWDTQTVKSVSVIILFNLK